MWGKRNETRMAVISTTTTKQFGAVAEKIAFFPEDDHVLGGSGEMACFIGCGCSLLRSILDAVSPFYGYGSSFFHVCQSFHRSFA